MATRRSAMLEASSFELTLPLAIISVTSATYPLPDRQTGHCCPSLVDTRRSSRRVHKQCLSDPRMKAAPTRVAAVVALAAWAYILAANTTRWRAALELSPDGVVHPVSNASTVTCSDHDVAANGSHSLELSVDEVRRDAIRAEFAWSWHAVRHVGD